MKRFLALIIALFLMFPVAVSGELAMDNQPDEFIGCWATFIPYSSTLYGDQSIIIVLNRDGTVSFFISIDNAKEGQLNASAETGKWTVVEDTIIYQRDGKDTYGLIKHHDDMIWFTMGGAQFGLRKIPEITISQVIYPDMNESE